jgi:hypothetical protein
MKKYDRPMGRGVMMARHSKALPWGLKKLAGGAKKDITR